MEHDYPVAQRPEAAFRAPAPPVAFFGRSETLREIDTRVVKQAPTTLGLKGAPGMGKTALALVLVSRLAALYPDGHVFIDLQAAMQPLTLEEVMGQVIHAVNPLVRLPPLMDGLEATYRQALHKRRLLLVLDNVGASLDLSRLVPPKGCLLLVTGGERFSWPEVRLYNLPGLTLDEARRLLLGKAPHLGEHADRLAGLCGHVPLALHLTADVLAARPDLDAGEYAGWLEQARARVAAPPEVEAAVAVAYGLLAPELQRLWRRLAVFPAEFDQYAASAVWGLSHDQAGQHLYELVRLGLLVHRREVRRFSLHEALRKAANARLDAGERQEARQLHAGYYARALAAAEEMYQQGGHGINRALWMFDLDRSNILAGQAWAAASADQDDLHAKLARQFGESGKNVVGYRLRPQGQVLWFEAASRAARRMGDRRSDTVLLSRLGSVYRNLGDLRQSIKYYDQSLRLARELNDRYLEGIVLDKLGLASAEMGHFRRAVDYYRQSLEIAREHGRQSDEARTSWNLGLAYKELGDLPAAIAAMQLCVDFERRIGHPNAAEDAAELEWLRLRQAGQAGHSRTER